MVAAPSSSVARIFHQGAFARTAPAQPAVRFGGDVIPVWLPAVRDQIQAAFDDVSAPVAGLNIQDLVSALNFLNRNMRRDTRAPWVGILDSGGLQFTWRADDMEVEAVFDATRGETNLWAEVASADYEADDIEMDSLFATLIDRLSLSSLAM